MSTWFRYVYRAYRYRYRVDRAELHFICRRLGRGQVAVDAGCHKGAYTYWMRRRVGASGTVFAFEPQPAQVGYLESAFAAMRYRNVTVVPMALSDRPGRLTLHTPTGQGYSTHAATLVAQRAAGGPTVTTEVDVTTLDSFFANEARGPDFIKIDVEGHELAVLEGARQTLERHHPALLIECEARHRVDGEVRPVFEFLRSFGYEGTFFQHGHQHPLAQFDPATHQPHLLRGDKPPTGYVNNFAFV